MNDIISIIVPCFNAAKFLRETIERILGQTYRSIELIVVDDGSTDGSKRILRSFKNRLKLIEQRHEGPSVARNRGIKASSGKFIALHDADDYWAPNCLKKLYNALIENQADVAYCGWQNVGLEEKVSRPFIPPKYESRDIIFHFLKSCPWPIHAALTRREIIEKLGGLDKRYSSTDDYDLWLRLSAITRNLILVPEILAFYRWHGTSQISSVIGRQALESWIIRKEFIRNNPNLVRHIERTTLRQLTDGNLLSAGYKAYWKRDLRSARQIFHKTIMNGYTPFRDLKYLLPALLPPRWYNLLIRSIDAFRYNGN